MFFLRYCTLKNPAIWLAKIILTHNWRTRLSTDKGFAVKYKWQCFILDYWEKKLNNFFFKKPHYFWPLCPFLGETECSSKFCSYHYFLKKLWPSIIVPKFEEVMSGFQATLVSEAHMHTWMEQAYHYALCSMLISTSRSISFWLWNKLFKC